MIGERPTEPLPYPAVDAEIFFDRNDKQVEVTAILKDAKWTDGTEGRRFLTGYVYRDTLRRWPDGEKIHTTYVLDEAAPEIFKTRSEHYYRVETWL